MFTRSCPAHTSIFADISPQLVAVHLENELCVIYWSRSGCGIYLLKRQRRRSAELLPLRWWTHIYTYLFIYAPFHLKCDRKEDLRISELGFHNTNGAASSCHKWTWTCVSVSSLSGRRCRSTMWRQVCSTREITWTARCLTATATFWPASLWRSSLVRFLFVLSSLKFGKTNHWRLFQGRQSPVLLIPRVAYLPGNIC